MNVHGATGTAVKAAHRALYHTLRDVLNALGRDGSDKCKDSSESEAHFLVQGSVRRDDERREVEDVVGIERCSEALLGRYRSGLLAPGTKRLRNLCFPAVLPPVS